MTPGSPAGARGREGAIRAEIVNEWLPGLMREARRGREAGMRAMLHECLRAYAFALALGGSDG